MNGGLGGHRASSHWRKPPLSRCLAMARGPPELGSAGARRAEPTGAGFEVTHRAGRSASNRHADGFQLGVKLNARAAMLAAEAGLLVAPEGHVRIHRVVAIHPDGAGADPGDQALNRREIV